MSLGPSGAALSRDHHENTAPTRAISSTTTQVPVMDESDKMQIDSAKAMRKILQEQLRRPPRTALTGRLTLNHNLFGACMPEIDMESADSHDSRGNAFDPEDLDIDDLRRPQLATTEAITGGGSAAQRIHVSAITELKKFSDRDHDDDRARRWVR